MKLILKIIDNTDWSLYIHTLGYLIYNFNRWLMGGETPGATYTLNLFTFILLIYLKVFYKLNKYNFKKILF